MNGNISNFMEERKATAEEAPYMEMKTMFNKKNPEKENIKPANKTQPSQGKQITEENLGLSLPLGEEYERKKQKLKQELRLDYRRFMSEKKYPSIAESPSHSRMLSLPIREHKSAKEKLQNERKKEYNLFLRGKNETQKTGKHSTTPQALERDCFGSVTPKYTVSPEVQAQRGSLSPEIVSSLKKDAATITESASGVHQRSRPRRRWLDTVDRLGHHSSSEEEQVEVELRNIQEDTGVARRDGKPHNGSHSRQAPTPAHSRSVNEQNMTEFATGLMIGAAEGDEASRKRKERYREELLQQIAEQRNNKRKEKELELRVAVTGVFDPEKQPGRIKQFGAVTREYDGKRRDVPYRPGVGLDVLMADSARRPKDQRPSQVPEERIPPDRPRVAFQSPYLDNSTVLSRLANAPGPGLEAGRGLVNGIAPITEDYHRSLSSTLGEMVAAPRVTGVRHPMAPSLPETSQTPYDSAYYLYGARHPVDPNLVNYIAASQQSNISPGAHWPVLQPPSLIQQSGQADVNLSGPGFHSSERLHLHKESALSYQEALKQQEFDRQGSEWNPLFLKVKEVQEQIRIQERQLRRHREKVDKELFDAKIEAEMKAYEPWGRAGGGAPLKDDHGNLISDLKQMHKTNVEAYDSGGRVTHKPAAPRTEPAGFSSLQPSLHTRGKLFNEPPTPQQIHEQEIYKDFLKQQIEEKKRKEAEERERCRLEEEKEERRLAEQRARIQREFEEEQERKRKKEKEQIAKNEELIRQAEERRIDEERKRMEAEERENEALRKRIEQEQRTVIEEVQRAPSPPLPALQKKLRQQVPRPPSVQSYRSAESLSLRSMSAPHSPPVPARRNEIRAKEDKKTVIRKLSALRKQLRSEQKRLEGQLIQSNRNDNTSARPSRQRELPPEDVFEMARPRKQVPIRRPASHTTANINTQNLQEFNRLKYRDSKSREEVRQAYPEPPGDGHSLDIQQQALLRQQQRTINNLRAKDAGYFDLVSLGQQHPEVSSAEDSRRHLLLESESAFIGPSGHSFLSQSRHNQRAARPAIRKMDISDDMRRYIRPDSGPDSQSVHSLTSTEIERLRERVKNKMTSLNNMKETESLHDWRSGDASCDEGEELWPQTPPPDHRRVSIDTVATESWLRPSSSDTVKRFIGGRRPSTRNHTSQDWEGPSTYHG